MPNAQLHRRTTLRSLDAQLEPFTRDRLVFRMDKLEHILAGKRFWEHADLPLGGRTGILDRPVPSQYNDHVRRTLDEQTEALLALRQRALGLLLLGDIAIDGVDSDLSAADIDRGPEDGNLDQRTIFAAPPRIERGHASLQDRTAYLGSFG